MLFNVPVLSVLTLSYFPPADVTSTFNQVIVTKCPESCWTFLKNLEKRVNPHTDPSLLNKLKDFYSKVFCKIPIRQFSKNSSYARMLIRYAELKGWVGLQKTAAPMLLLVLDFKKNSDVHCNSIKQGWRPRRSPRLLHFSKIKLQRICLCPHFIRPVWG